MPLVGLKEVLPAAQANEYGVAAFTIDNLEVISALIEAAAAETAPAIIQAGPVGLEHAGWEPLAATVRALAQRSASPIVLHLDHGANFEQAERAIDLGFTSVMVDGSALPDEEKLALTKRVTDLAHRRGVTVEAELGPIAGNEEGISITDHQAVHTDPAEAARFVKDTGVDALAVSIGNVHWVGETPAELDLKRLRTIRGQVEVPLVLHGGSGVAPAQLRKAIQRGITKINIAYVINHAFSIGLEQALASVVIEAVPGRKHSHPHKSLRAAKAAAREAAQEQIRLFGSSEKA